MLEPQDSEYIWIVVLGFILAFVLAFGIGANDVANSFGTSVGSKVLTLKQACIIASIFEVAGAVLIGTRVSDTVRKGIIDINSFNGTEELAMVGSLSALTGTSAWLLIATFFNLPVSGTHSVVGATMGFALVAHGLAGVKWSTFGKIGLVLQVDTPLEFHGYAVDIPRFVIVRLIPGVYLSAGSWVISPLMSGIMSSLIFQFVKVFILNKTPPLEAGLKYLPCFYAFTVTVNLFSVFYKGSQVLGFHKIPLYGVFILTFGGGIITAILVRVFLVPYMRRRVLREIEQDNEVADDETFGIELDRNKNPSKNDTGDEQLVADKDHQGEDEFSTGLDISPIEKKCELRSDSSAEQSELLSEITSPEKFEIKGPSAMEIARKKIQDEPKTAKLFSFLQILTACFGAFAHGGNDVSNCIGPLISLWTIFYSGYIHQKVAIPVWILFYGGAGISIGLWVWGRRVIKTVGEDLTPITPSSGFCIEIGSAITVLIASNLGIPISTTHCKVGSVVMVGRVRSKMVVDWSIFKNVVFAWIVTMPVAGGLSAAMYAILREVI